MPAAAKSLQSCPTLCDPIDGSPPALVYSNYLYSCYFNSNIEKALKPIFC